MTDYLVPLLLLIPALAALRRKENAYDILRALEQEHQNIYNTALTLGRLGQAVHQPRLPDKGASMQYDFSLPPSAYLEDDLAQASRICPKEAHYEV